MKNEKTMNPGPILDEVKKHAKKSSGKDTQKWRRDFGLSISNFESEKKTRFGSSN